MADDLDGDGLDDLVLAGHLGDVGILLALGNGSFLEKERHPLTNDFRVTLVAADFDQDGAPDLAVSYLSEHTDRLGAFRLLPNRGDGSFAEPLRFNIGFGPHAMSTGDFTGDGVLDLAITHVASRRDRFSVYRGIGDGTFEVAVRRTIGSEEGVCGGACGNPSTSTMVDLDGDGHLDVVTGRLFGSELTVLFGAGDGSIARVLRHHPGFRPKGLTAADLDADGDIDLVPGGGQTILVNCSRP